MNKSINERTRMKDELAGERERRKCMVMGELKGIQSVLQQTDYKI